MHSSTLFTPALFLLISSFAAAQCQNSLQGNDRPGPVINDDIIYGVQPSSQPSAVPPTAIGSIDSSFGGPSGTAGGFVPGAPHAFMEKTVASVSMKGMGDSILGGSEMAPRGMSSMGSMGSMSNMGSMGAMSNMGSMGAMDSQGVMGKNMNSMDTPNKGVVILSSNLNPGSLADQYDDGGYYPETDPNASGSNPYETDNDNDNDNDNYNDCGYPEYTSLPISGPVPTTVPTATMSGSVSAIPTAIIPGYPVYQGAAAGRCSIGAGWMLVAVAAGAALFV